MFSSDLLILQIKKNLFKFAVRIVIFSVIVIESWNRKLTHYSFISLWELLDLLTLFRFKTKIIS